MLNVNNHIEELEVSSPGDLLGFASEFQKPFVVRDLVSKMPIVKMAKNSTRALEEYLLGFSIQRKVTVSLGDPELNGRLFYNEDFSADNCQSLQVPVEKLFELLHQHENNDAAPLIYMGSTDIDGYFPGLAQDNDSPVAGQETTARIWIGNRCRIAAHFDQLDNLACAISGKRRFTVFAPEQVDNLYIGPIDLTPAGQPISLVDFHNPDFSRYPKFAHALNAAQTTLLEPGDAIYIPSLWWHHVESLGRFNVLLNYWWRTAPAFLGEPMDALMHSIWAIRDLPENQKQAWFRMFERYVFDHSENDFNHIPSVGRRVLDPLDGRQAKRIRTYLNHKLNR